METTPALQKNQDVTLDITALGSDGQGLGRIDGFVVFVPNALPGETVEARIIKTTARYAVGKLLRVLQPSPERVDPPCPVHGRCGGCQLQHMNYEAQLVFKRTLVADALRTIGGIAQPAVRDVLPMEDPWRYRNKGIFPVGKNGETVLSGMYAQRSHSIIAVDDCRIQPREIMLAVNAVRDWAQKNGISVYDENTGKGLLRHVMLRAFPEQDASLAVLVINGTVVPAVDPLIQALRDAVPGLRGILLNTNRENTNVVLGSQAKALWGDASIPVRLGDNTYEIGAHSFFQVNLPGMRLLYAEAAKAAALTGTELLIDAYCGVGTIGQFMAGGARKIIGIESVPQSIEEARRSAERNSIRNAEYICGRAEDEFERLAREGIRPDVIVMDPPRKGCDERFLQAVADTGAGRLVYVSCNPATLARDVKFLLAHSYELGTVQPVDLFPQTVEVETVAQLTRVGD